MKFSIFLVFACLLTLPVAFADSEISVKTDSDSYVHEEIAIVTGESSGNNISLQVKDPSGKTILIRTISVEDNFSFELNLPTYFIFGQYTISVSTVVDGIPQIAKTSFTLLDETAMPVSQTSTSTTTPTPTSTEDGGGCLIATAAFGSEMAPQVQFLREIRDNTVLQTQSGTAFMTGFNQFYYSFSPQIADYERENPIFKETVKVTLTPLLTSLTLLNYADIDSEEEMLGYGIGIILLNVGMYFVLPASLIIFFKRRIRN